MAFSGFSAEGIDLLQMNRLQNSKEFYEIHKAEIKQKAVEPFYELCRAIAPQMLEIDAQFVTVPSRMVSRVRRDTRYTKDKTLYRATLWCYFRRPRAQFEDVPAFYMEAGPEHWAYGCWGGFGRGEMAELRELVLAEDRRFLDAKKAVASCQRMHLSGDFYKRLKYKEAKNPDDLFWLNTKSIGCDFREEADFAPLLDGSFVDDMVSDFIHLKPFYDLLLTIKDLAATKLAGVSR